MDQLNEFLLLSTNNIFPSELENSKAGGESFILQDNGEFLSLLSEFVFGEHKEAAKQNEILSSLFVKEPTVVMEEENIDNFKDKDEMSELLERINGSNQLLPKNVDDKKMLIQNEEKSLKHPVFTHEKNSRLPVNNQDIINNEQNKIDIDTSIHVEKALTPLSQTIDRTTNIVSLQKNLAINPFLNADKISTKNQSFNENELIHQLVAGLDSQAVASLNKSELTQLNTVSSSQRELASESLLARVNIMLAKNFKQADIYLDPPELGRLQIRLVVNQDTASIQFTVTNQVAKEIIEQSFPKLKEMFQQHGLQIAQSSVQQETNTQQSFVGEQMQQQNRERQKNLISQIIDQQEIEDEDGVINLRLNLNQSKAGVDYYA